MKITVILCTFNRSRSLARALESVAVSRMPEDAVWEVLVVDNNSSDETPQVVREFQRRFPGKFQYVFEPTPGKSNALNRAIRATDSGVLAFMDDDVQVDPEWLQRLTEIFKDKEYIGAGGCIFPETGFVCPEWLEASQRYALAPLAMFDLGRQAGDLHEPPFGTNMAFRREAFSRFGEFRRDLGPQPGSEIRSEDTEFGMRVITGGGRLWYEPSAIVYHEVSQKRLQPAYFLRWWFDKGRGDVREHGVQPGTKWFIAGVPLYLIRRVVVWTIRWLLSIRPGPRFTAKLSLWKHFGEIEECRYHARSDRQHSPITDSATESRT